MNKSLLVDLYEFTMAQSYFLYKQNTRATFDLFVRQLPVNRNYLIACGLVDIISYLRELRFSPSDIKYLRSRKLFSREFLRYLINFKFSGDVWALPEGEIFFANEPIVRVTAPIIEAQILESYFLNTLNLQTMIASKATRVVCSARGKGVFDFSLRRTHGSEAGLKAARASFIAGCNGTSNVLAGKLYGIPVVGTMAHSFVMSFRDEMSSFLAYSEVFPDKAVLLVDTYDTHKGLDNAVAIGLYLREKGHRLQGIRLDSGDIVSLSRLARKRLDQAGLCYVKIFASGNLDEARIDSLLRQGAAIDNFGVGTNMGTSIDAPCLDVIYKISEVTDENGKFLPTMKLSKDKVTFPGRKQIYRVYDKRHKCLKDIVGLEGEKIKGRPLLIKVVDKGKIIYHNPSPDRIRDFSRQQLFSFSSGIRNINGRYSYRVGVSCGLQRLRERLRAQLKSRQ